MAIRGSRRGGGGSGGGGDYIYVWLEGSGRAEIYGKFTKNTGGVSGKSV